MDWTPVLPPVTNKIAIKYRSRLFKHGINSSLGAPHVCFASFTFLGGATGSRLGRAVPAREHAVAVWPLAARRAFADGEELAPFAPAGWLKWNQKRKDVETVRRFLTVLHLHITPSTMGSKIKKEKKKTTQQPNQETPEQTALRFPCGPRDAQRNNVVCI